MVIYLEGGGDSKVQHIECRKGFRLFIEKAGLKGQMPRTHACGGRQNAYETFCHAVINNQHAGECLLLVDSETPVTAKSPWDHLKNRTGDEWTCPTGADESNCHLMVECMEGWFFADKDAVKGYFGKDFHEKSLPANPHIEEISKAAVFAAIHAATRQCTTKGVYSKGNHSFELLGKIDPNKVSTASPWAKRFLETLNRMAR